MPRDRAGGRAPTALRRQRRPAGGRGDACAAALAAGMPGAVPAASRTSRPALRHAAARASLAPAIAHARDGFAVDPRYARIAATARARSCVEAQRGSDFLDGGVRTGGWPFVLRQPELARDARARSRARGQRASTGRVAQALVETAVNAAGARGGSPTSQGYRIVEREPVRFTYRGATHHRGCAALRRRDRARCRRWACSSSCAPATYGPENAHLVIEALRRAFRRPGSHLGDSRLRVGRPLATAGLEPDYARAPRERASIPRHATTSAAGRRRLAHGKAATRRICR
jgi:gamma-glutamyltranspeptidase / glutathione hydrolase